MSQSNVFLSKLFCNVRRASLVIGLSCFPLLAQPTAPANTERLDFPSGGVLKLENTTGVLSVEGWDRPDVEIAAFRVSEKGREAVENVHLNTARNGDELVVKTDLPRHRPYRPPAFLSSDRSFEYEFDIKAPRNARLEIDHYVGEIYVKSITGDLRITAREGEILVQLPDDRKYAIDAKNNSGAILSDFPGQEKRTRWQLGHQFTESPSDGSQKLYMRLGDGDIILLREWLPKMLAAKE